MLYTVLISLLIVDICIALLGVKVFFLNGLKKKNIRFQHIIGCKHIIIFRRM